MEKETRNAIERATQRIRGILEKDFAEQLQGDYDVMQDGRVGERPGRAPDRRPAGPSRPHRRRDRAQARAGHDAEGGRRRLPARRRVHDAEPLRGPEDAGSARAGAGMRQQGRASSGFATSFAALRRDSSPPDGSGYRLYIESIFDELSTEVKVLFDRRDPASALWPRSAAFEDLLGLLNADDC